MLSLRDSGKIQQGTESILQLAKECGFAAHLPFSLKDFILKDCIVNVTRLRLCVVLFSWTPPDTDDPTFDKKDKAWYENYFLNWNYPNGIARYWYKQSFGKLKIEGKVLDWTVFKQDPKSVLNKNADDTLSNVISRYTALGIAKNIATSKNEVLESYDGFIAVMGVDAKYIVAGDNDGGNGSTFAIGTNHNHTCHEVGHIIGNTITSITGKKLGFHHSYGLETHIDDQGGYCDGNYGYSYCIMSAELYGARGGVIFTPPQPPSIPDFAGEEMQRGPGLNGGTRAFLGWANTIEFNLDSETEPEFELQSLGSNRPSPQVVVIAKGERKYFIEYRSSSDECDQGIANLGFDGVLVAGIVTGGIATIAPTDAPANGTFLQEIPINFNASLPGTIINLTPFWGVKLVSINSRRNIIRIKILRHFQFSLRVYRRTHDITLSDGTSSFHIESAKNAQMECNDYNSLRRWRIDGQPLKSLRSLAN